MVRVNDKDEETEQSGPPSSIASDGSFVILERSARPLQPNGDPSLPSSVAFSPDSLLQHPRESLSPSYIPGSLPDLSPEEIQKKLAEVLQENVELKETLHQNNLAMKQQFNTLVMWQDEVFKVHQNHKEKFQETKELILKLRAENAELKNYLDIKSGSTSDSQLKAENARLKGQVAELEQKLLVPMPRCDHDRPPSAGVASKKEEELTELVKRLNRQLEIAERARRQLTIDAESTAAKHDRAEREVAAVRKELDDMRQAYQTLRQQNEDLVQKMQQGDERVLAESQQLFVQQACGDAAAADLTSASAYESKLQELGTSLTKQANRYASLDKWLQSAAANLQLWKPSKMNDNQCLLGLKGDIADLQKVLAQEQAYGAEKKAFLTEIKSRLQQMLADHQAQRVEWETYRQEQRAQARHDNAYHDVQARGFAEKLDRLTAEVLCKEEEIKENEKDMKELKEQVRQLEVENEAIPILKAQVEVYQSDFNAEREAREQLAGEKERLAEDLRHLQRRNQQLLDEAEALQRSHFDNMHSPNSGWSTVAAPGRAAAVSERVQGPIEEEHASPPRVYDEEVPPPKEYICPMCRMAFKQLDHLEYHVETCLESCL